jgi:hypothetical protein
VNRQVHHRNLLLLLLLHNFVSQSYAKAGGTPQSRLKLDVKRNHVLSDAPATVILLQLKCDRQRSGSLKSMTDAEVVYTTRQGKNTREAIPFSHRNGPRSNDPTQRVHFEAPLVFFFLNSFFFFFS